MTDKELYDELEKLGSLIQFDYAPIKIGGIFKTGYGRTDLTWEFIKDKVLINGADVLVVGACLGYIPAKILEHSPNSVTAVEIDQRSCMAVRKILDHNAGGEEKRAAVKCGDFINVGLGSYDVCFCLNVLQHFKQKEPNLEFKKGGEDYRRLALQKLARLITKQIIFEVDTDDVLLVYDYFGKWRSKQEHLSPGRENRRVLIFEN